MRFVNALAVVCHHDAIDPLMKARNFQLSHLRQSNLVNIIQGPRRQFKAQLPFYQNFFLKAKRVISD